MRESKSVLCAHAPWHRVERAPDPDGIHMQLLTALKPEQGWPRLWAWVPVRRRGGGHCERFERLAGAPAVHTESFHAEPGSSPGEPLRHALALRHFPAGPATGLLCLFIYLDPRADAEEGGNGAALADLREQDLDLAIDELLQSQPALPDWGHAFVPGPSFEAEGAAGELGFLLAACQYPPGMLDVSRGAERDPALASPADAAMARLLAFCRQHPAGRHVSLLLIAGDEIYADASGGLADPSTSAERYARPYQHFKAGLARYLPPTLARIVHAPDDHEVQDNCEPCLLADGSHDPGEYTASARAAAWQYRWEPDGQRTGSATQFWHSFEWRGAAFFIADSRLEREPRTVARVAEAQMISAAQRQAFSAWLTASAGRPRFVLSGALLLPRRRSSAAHVSGSLRSDAWCGFPASQQWLLAELWRQRASGVVFLSGDEHRSGHVSAELRRADGQGPALRLHSIHSSALYAPWPFAITDSEEFAAPEVFGIDAASGAAPHQTPSSELLCCEVGEWQDHPGDGFTWLRVTESGARLELRYDKAGAGALYAAMPMRAADAVLQLD